MNERLEETRCPCALTECQAGEFGFYFVREVVPMQGWEQGRARTGPVL